MTVPLWLMQPTSQAHVMMRTTLRVSAAKAERELGRAPVHPSGHDGLAALKAAV